MSTEMVVEKPQAARTKKPPKTQQGRVLEVLWVVNGGPTKLARSLKLTESVLNSWKRILQKVPLAHVGNISRKLKVSTYLLNYKEICDLQGDKPDWEKTVREYKKFTPEQLEYIFKGKAP